MKTLRFAPVLLTMLALLVAAPIASAQTANTDLLPPDAQPGECYARVWVPAVYATETVEMLAKEKSERIEVVPAKYEWAEEKVLVKEGHQRLEIIPATYEWVEETVLVKPAANELKYVPATYEWAEEKIMDQPAHTMWKRGESPAQRLDNATGEIMCLVEIPATYKIVRKRVVKTPATVREVDIPAEHKTIKRREVKTAETTRTIDVPAEYKTVKVRKLVSPASEKRIEIPAEYKTVTKRDLVTEGHMEWRAILCQTNMQTGLVSQIQTALNRAGHNAGTVDGVMGSQTLHAIESFQKAKNLARGGLTMETLEALGVSYGG